MRRFLVAAVCCLPFVLSLTSAGDSSTQALHGKIVYSSDRGPNVRNSEIYSIGVDGARRVDLSRNQAEDGGFAWSPTGDRVAFWSALADPAALYVVRADGSGLQRLTPAGIQVSDLPT